MVVIFVRNRRFMSRDTTTGNFVGASFDFYRITPAILRMVLNVEYFGSVRSGFVLQNLSRSFNERFGWGKGKTLMPFRGRHGAITVCKTCLLDGTNRKTGGDGCDIPHLPDR